jgi:hypothetical protein
MTARKTQTLREESPSVVFAMAVEMKRKLATGGVTAPTTSVIDRSYA